MSDLIINNVTIDDQVFSVDKTQFTIASNEKEVINVSFLPVSLGMKETEIRFNSDALTILLRAIGNGAFPIASISQNTLIFGTVVVNSSKTLSISIFTKFHL